MSLQISAIPAFNDNYIWLLRSGNSDSVFVVDPGDAAPVRAYLSEHRLMLAGILLTHHHPDHTGGVTELCEYGEAAGRSTVPVYGPHSARIPQVTEKLVEGDTITVLGESFEVIEIPGHTLDHIAYYSTTAGADSSSPVLFCGDTLFAGGCGRLFEGTAEMMYTSLRKLASLPETTRVYCAHEYTVANLAFAAAAEPNNPDIRDRWRIAQQERQNQQMTVPSTLLVELRTNPFLRCHSENLQSAVAQHSGQFPEDEIKVFTLLRQWKDQF